MAAARGLVRQLLPPHMGVGALAGFLGAASVASAASDQGAGACPAYPWPHDGAQQGGRKVFMQSDCAACHSMLPYAGLREAAATGGEVEPRVAEIVVVDQEAQPATETPRHGGAYSPDLTVVTKTLVGQLRRNNVYSAQELKKKMALPAPVWLQFFQPYMRTPQAA